MKTLCPLWQLRGWGSMSDAGQKHFGIDWAARTFENPANGNHSNYAIHAHEAVLDVPPLAIPADQARMNLEGVKCFEVMTKLGNRISDHGERFVLSCNSKNASTHKPIHTPKVGKRKISAIVDVEVEI